MSTHKPIRTVVFPVAGLGTRFLPATKMVPKELLPVVDKPLIQYAVEEALEAGIDRFIFITGRGKGAIEDHFDKAFELEVTLDARNKNKELALLHKSMPQPGQMMFVRQQEPLGLGHAVWCAHKIVGDEPFAVILPDDMVLGEKGCLAQMVKAYNETGGNLVAVEEVPHEHTNRYGVLNPGETSGALTEIKGLVEKPDPSEAPSNLAIIGRYILQPEVFLPLTEGKRGSGNEIQLTDAMATLLGKQSFHGFSFEGKRFDCGDKIGFLEANIAYGMAREDIRPGLTEILAKY
ncbi:MAG: UTP--glucose-1-phosphate uridylyltransferase GalU [Parvibaculaceae bacterium]|nr:UTP--glucose-1-phosphate uridylyltransferase GalU [Parvibaculaceae bacterium]